MSCSTPISWLALERLHLGELAGEEKKRVEQHLSECGACAATLKSLVEEDEKRSLPLRTRSKKQARPKVVSLRAWIARPRVALSGLAVAAAAIFLVGRSPKTPDIAADRFKGSSEVGFMLVREDDAVLPEAGGPYREGERFKVLVTCPPGWRGNFDLVVYEANAPASFPLSATTDLPCGNAVPLAGAFKLMGRDAMTVCLVWQAGGALDRAALARASPATLLDARQAQCKTLTPMPEE